jgi:hypothetical protein
MGRTEIFLFSRGRTQLNCSKSTRAGDQFSSSIVELLTVHGWQPLAQLFSPGSRPPTTKIGRGHTGYRYLSKISARAGYQINLRSGAIGKKIFTLKELTL